MADKKVEEADAVLIPDNAGKEVAVYSPGALIAQAIEKGSDLSQLQTILDVQVQWEANEAKKAYNLAMAEFKKAPPEIIKDGTVDYTPSGKSRVLYNHSTLANVATTINKALGEHGLSATWRTDQPEGKGIKVTCVITHELGHSEETSLTAAPDATGGKNAIQQVGSTVTYLQRYTILSMTGLATKEADDDGRGSDVEYISEEQENVLDSMIKDNAPDPEAYMEKFLEYMEVSAIAEIPAKKFKVAETAVKSAIKAVKK